MPKALMVPVLLPFDVLVLPVWLLCTTLPARTRPDEGRCQNWATFRVGGRRVGSMLSLPVPLLTGGPTMVAAAHPSSFGELVRRAADARPDHLAVIDADVRWSWAELS